MSSHDGLTTTIIVVADCHCEPIDMPELPEGAEVWLAGDYIDGAAAKRVEKPPEGAC